MTPTKAFFALHSDLPREGPGSREDLDWAIKRANIPADARVLDAGCGPGADIEGLLAHAPEGHVSAVDTHVPFVDAVKAHWGGDGRVTAMTTDMRDIDGPFEFIWCAGALYFLGLETGLPLLGSKLAPGGSIAFSDLVYIGSKPAQELRTYLEAEVPLMRTQKELQDAIRKAGFQSLGQRVLPKSSWEAYFAPMEQKIAKLRPGASAALAKELDAAEYEIAMWNRYSDTFGYVLSVVRPA